METKFFSLETLNLADAVGEFIQYWGFKKIHGQIWLLAFVSKEPIDACMLCHDLKVTKGLISTSIKTLIEYNLISEVDIGDKRSKYYQANPDFTSVIVSVLTNRELKIIDKVKLHSDNLNSKVDNRVDDCKIKKLKALIKLGEVLIKGVIGFKVIDLTFWKFKR